MPDPATIRPENVLKKSLAFLMSKWEEGTCEYGYIQEQFKSIRQDLLVQHIKNEFAVEVCENNARICLESHDILQFMQCSQTLEDLYKQGIHGN